MAIGLKLGRAETMEGMLQNLGVAREFRRRFEEEMGEIGCSELTGLDWSKDEDVGGQCSLQTGRRAPQRERVGPCRTGP